MAEVMLTPEGEGAEDQTTPAKYNDGEGEEGTEKEGTG